MLLQHHMRCSQGQRNLLLGPHRVAARPIRDLRCISSPPRSPRDAGSLNHVAFRVGSLTELRRRYEQLSAEDTVTDVDPVSHGSWLSVYYRDPENNRMEFFWDTPWYVKQPIIDALDFSLSDEEILRVTEETYCDFEGFRPMSEWRAEAVRNVATEDA